MMRLIALLLSATAARAEPMLTLDFSDPTRWSYVSDRVMGGVSDGGASLLSEDGQSFARLAGEVSTANNGGFIQIRTALPGLPEGTTALRLTVRGNGETYAVHLRTRGIRAPWLYHAASFTAPADWTTIDLPLAGFSSERLPGPPLPEEVTSLGIVAYGADYTARLDIARIEAVTD